MWETFPSSATRFEASAHRGPAAPLVAASPSPDLGADKGQLKNTRPQRQRQNKTRPSEAINVCGRRRALPVGGRDTRSTKQSRGSYRGREEETARAMAKGKRTRVRSGRAKRESKKWGARLSPSATLLPHPPTSPTRTRGHRGRGHAHGAAEEGEHNSKEWRAVAGDFRGLDEGIQRGRCNAHYSVLSSNTSKTRTTDV
ncbi:hypothetical protein B0H19DRAFT_1234407 [Mycena capillaripes]|nr:hypothetical protein B0H19DRAFT_1234407 [Mycena capillaripes]